MEGPTLWEEWMGLGLWGGEEGPGGGVEGFSYILFVF